MKLRVSNNSIRLRLLRSEVSRFAETGRVEETVHLGVGEHSSLTYALEFKSGLEATEVRFESMQIRVVVSENQAKTWARSDQTGLYATVDLGNDRSLSVTIEKDFACLDRDDADNRDTFSNPLTGALC